MQATAPLTLWVLVNKYDVKSQGEKVEKDGNKQLVSVPMWPHWSARDVQVALMQALGHTRPSGSSIVRLRDAQGGLLALTPTTLKSTPTQPLTVELGTDVNYGGETDLPMLPVTLKTTVEKIITRLEARVSVAEAGLSSLKSRRAALVEAELRRIQDTLTFMSRRLDYTCAPTWVTGGQT